MATERFSLVIDSQTTGTEGIQEQIAAIQKLQIESVKANAEAARASRQHEDYVRTIKAVTEATVAAGAGLLSYSGSLAAVAAGASQATGGMDGIVNSFRAFRIISSPTLFTAATIGLGLIAEKAFRATLEMDRLAQSAAFMSARNGVAAGSIFQLQLTERARGLQDGTLTSLGRDPNSIANLAEEFSKIKDPVEKAKKAVEEFGDNAEKYLPMMTIRLRDNIDASAELAASLDTHSGAAMRRFAEDLKAPVERLREMADWFTRVNDAVNLFAAKGVAKVHVALRDAGDARSRAEAADQKWLGSSPRADVPSYQEIIRSMGTSGEDTLRRLLGARVPESRISTSIAANAAASARFETLDEAKGMSSFAASRLARLREQYNTRPESRDLIASALIQAKREAESWQARVDAMEDAKKLAINIDTLNERISNYFSKNLIDADVKRSGIVPNYSNPNWDFQGGSTTELGSKSLLLGTRFFEAMYSNDVLGNDTRAGRQGSDLLASQVEERQLAHEIKLRRTGMDTDFARQGIEQNGQRIGKIAALSSEDQGIAIGASARARMQAAAELRNFELSQAEKLDGLKQQELARYKAELDYKKEEQAVRIDTEIKTLELVKQQREQFQGFVSGLTGASFGGASGIQSFLKGQGQGIVSKMASNATGLLFPTGAPGILSSITGTAENPTTIGKLLSGTILGPKASDPLKSATDLNTDATNRNTAAIYELGDYLGAPISSSRVSGTIGGGGGILGSIGKIGGLFGGAGGPLGMIFSGFGKNSGDQMEGDFSGIPTVPGMPAGMEPDLKRPSQKLIGYAAAAIGAGLGAYQISKGGAQNVLGGASGIMGGAASIMALSGMTGPAAPIVAGIGLALGLTSMIMGDPKKRRADQEARRLMASQFVGPEAINISSDIGGGYSDSDKYGNIRTSNLSPFPMNEQPYFDYRHATTVPGRTTSPYGGSPITVNISAIDAQSFQTLLTNNPDALAAGFQNAVQMGGNGIIPTIREQL